MFRGDRAAGTPAQHNLSSWPLTHYLACAALACCILAVGAAPSWALSVGGVTGTASDTLSGAGAAGSAALGSSTGNTQPPAGGGSVDSGPSGGSSGSASGDPSGDPASTSSDPGRVVHSADPAPSVSGGSDPGATPVAPSTEPPTTLLARGRHSGAAPAAGDNDTVNTVADQIGGDNVAPVVTSGDGTPVAGSRPRPTLRADRRAGSIPSGRSRIRPAPRRPRSTRSSAAAGRHSCRAAAAPRSTRSSSSAR